MQSQQSQLQGQVPNLPGVAYNLFDQATSGWTQGRQLTFPLPSRPTIVRPWTINAFGVQGQGVLTSISNQIYGVLGKILAALMLGPNLPPGNQVFSQPPQAALNNLITLWDGSEEPPFPFWPGGTGPFPAGGYFSGFQQLPVPQTLNPGDQIALGLWLTPALLNHVGTVIHDVSYTVLYEQ